VKDDIAQSQHIRIVPRCPSSTTDSTLLPLQETTPRPRESNYRGTQQDGALSVSSLLGEALLSTGRQSETGRAAKDFDNAGADPGNHVQTNAWNHDLEISPTSTPTSSLGGGTVTPPSAMSRALSLSPPPLVLHHEEGDFDMDPVKATAEQMMKGKKLPPRRPGKDRTHCSGISSIHNRVNSETSLLSALTIDTSYPHQNWTLDKEKRKHAALDNSSSSLQQPVLDDSCGGPNNSLSSGGFSLPMRQQQPHRRQKSSSSSFSNIIVKPKLPKAVFLPEYSLPGSESSSTTAFRRVANDRHSSNSFTSIQSVLDEMDGTEKCGMVMICPSAETSISQEEDATWTR
jgi:hypothetical protein